MHSGESKKYSDLRIAGGLAITAADRPGEIWQRLRLDDSGGIGLHESICDFFAADFGRGLAGRGEYRNTLFGIVRIRG